jgi:hypothetical protein
LKILFTTLWNNNAEYTGIIIINYLIKTGWTKISFALSDVDKQKKIKKSTSVWIYVCSAD